MKQAQPNCKHSHPSPEITQIDINHYGSVESAVQSVIELQSRFDDITSGRAVPNEKTKKHPDSEELFSFYNSEDLQRASLLATIGAKIIIENNNSLQGFHKAFDAFEKRIGQTPIGMVEYATKLFCIYCETERYLVRRSPEYYQPGLNLSRHNQPTLNP
jgi:hypothetical protein